MISFQFAKVFGEIRPIGKRNQGVQMIRHQQAKMNKPVLTFLAKFDRLPNDLGSGFGTELIGVARGAADGDKKNGFAANPRRKVVRKF